MSDPTTAITKEQGVIIRMGIEEERTSPLFQEKIFLIMWKSNRSGGTYSQLRKSIEGKDRFLRSLAFLGVNLSEVTVVEQTKVWVPVRQTKPKKVER